MKLKQLELIGFKSFADKTVIKFHDGITGIVGPNGCGKSNIADAFRWVMGEQSAKSMRGNKMLDVIFAGTNKRKPLNYSEVTITMTDIDGQLPIEYEEVAITRRLHRNGESDYFINRKSARLKDIHDLLLDTGIGKNSFSMFEQGKMDQVIHYSPLERRTIFEEASGILRFLQRKKEALRKLEHTDSNLSRVRDILAEVERQIIVLEKQAEEAKIYKENKSLLESLEKSLFSSKRDRFQKRIENGLEKQQEQKQQIEDAEAQLHLLEQEVKKGRDLLLEAEKQLQEQNEALYQTRSDKEIKTKEKRGHQERLQELTAKEQQWLQELESMQEKRRLRQEESETLQKSRKILEEKLEELHSVRETQSKAFQAIESEVNRLRDRQTETQRQLLSLTQKEKQYDSELNQARIRLENSEERKTRIDSRKNNASTAIKEIMENLDRKKQEVSSAKNVVSQNKETLSEIENRYILLRQKIKEKQVQYDLIVKELTEHHARQKILVRLREEMEGFSKCSKQIMKEAKKKESPLFGKIKGLYEYLTPGSGYDAFLRPYAQTMVVETAEDFLTVTEYARQNQLKDFSLICLTHLAVPLSESFLNSIVTVDRLEDAWEKLKQSPRAEILVKEGPFIDQRQVAFFATAGGNNVFLREAELKGLQKKISNLEANHQTVQQELESDKQSTEELQREKTRLERQYRDDELKLVETEFALKRLYTDLDKAQTDSQQHGKELESLNEAILKISDSIGELSCKHAEAAKQSEEFQKSADSLSRELQEKTEKLKNEQRGVVEKSSAYTQAVEENRRQQHQLNLLEVKNQESLDHEKRLREEIESSRLHQKEIKEKFGGYDEILLEVESRLAEVNARRAELQGEVEKQRKAILSSEEKLEEHREKAKSLEEQLYEIKIQLAQLNSAREALENEFFEHYHMPLSDLQAEPSEESIEQTERKVRSLRNKIDAAGNINMTSIDEFENHKERYQFLSRQIDDLNEAKNELIEIITQLDTESRKIFTDTFATIRENFRKNFAILFQGGEADLEFTETEDVLEAGIEIIAKPPGKKMRSIQLLSGGEKCLTAVALMFAIFEVKPAPFCLLDEIDAPLDDTNVSRFLNIVQQFQDRCQFIIITHNKCTMEMADILFGVSMQEKGVSKLLSVDFTEDAKPEPVMVS